jgi:tRNA (cmo5U34)-methyltransferase
MGKLNDFDFVARYYAFLSKLVFGRKLQDAQTHFLPMLDNATKVLIVGGGSGEVALLLAQRNEGVKITFVEPSLRMVEMARKRCHKYLDRIDFVTIPIEDFPTTANYDAVITGFFLDMFSDDMLPMIVDRLRRQLVAGGKLLATDFTKSPQNSHRLLLWVMYRFFRIVSNISATDLPDWEKMLRSRLITVAQKDYCSGFIRSVAYTNG